MHSKKRQIWQYPWQYKEGIVLAVALFVVGILIELFSDTNGVEPLSWPANIITLVVFINVLIFVYVFFHKKQIVKWLTSVPASIVAIVFFTLLVFVLGLVPQNNETDLSVFEKAGFTNITSSWMFILSQLFLLTILGLVTIKRAILFSRRNIGFLLNHAGLWVTISAAVLGAGDLKILTINLSEGQNFTNIAHSFSKQSIEYQIPMSLRLLNFNIEFYRPKIALMHIQRNMLYYETNMDIVYLEDNLSTKLHIWQIDVDKFHKLAIIKDSFCAVSTQLGAAPAAYISVTNTQTNHTSEGWISCGSFAQNRKILPVDDSTAVVMIDPEAKQYSSDIVYITNEGKRDTVTVEVNRPVSIEGWKIYQSGFDERFGHWSSTSVLEIVHDPWLTFVYSGIFMMMAGAIYMLWVGNSFPPKKIGG